MCVAPKNVEEAIEVASRAAGTLVLLSKEVHQEDVKSGSSSSSPRRSKESGKRRYGKVSFSEKTLSS